MSKKIRITIDIDCNPEPKKPKPTDGLKITLTCDTVVTTKKGHKMLVTLTPGQVAKAVISPTAKGKPTNATLSGIEFDSSDVTVFDVSPDPAVPNGCLITGKGTGTATTAQILFSALATETDGVTKNQVKGQDDVTCSLAPPPPDVTDGLAITLTDPGTPIPPPIPGK